MKNMEESDKYQKFIEWKCKKLGPKDPQTLEIFCEENQITQEDVQRFVSKATFADDIVNGSMNWARARTPQMLHMLYENILSNKSSTDIKDFIALTNELKKKKDEKSNLTQINFFNLDERKFRNIAARYNSDALSIGEGYDGVSSEGSEGQVD